MMNEFQVGSKLLECRPRIRLFAWVEAGTPPIPVIIGPLFIAGLLTIIPLVVAREYYNVPPPMKHPTVAAVTTFWFVLLLVTGYAFIFTAPPNGSFVIYDNGFKYKGRFIGFSDIGSLQGGMAPSSGREVSKTINEMLSPVSRHARSAAAILQAQEDTSLTLVLKGGETWTLKGVLAAYEIEDLNKFLDCIADNTAIQSD